MAEANRRLQIEDEFTPLCPPGLTSPFGLHINADWLLNISRSGVRQIEADPWQSEILSRIADLLAKFLDWVSRYFSEPAAVRAAFSVLASPVAGRSDLETQLAGEGWRSRLRNCLKSAAVFPVWNGTADALGFASPADITVPPPPLAKAFAEEQDLRPPILLQGPVLRSKLVGTDALELLESIGLFNEMSPRALQSAWPDGLKNWWGRHSQTNLNAAANCWSVCGPPLLTWLMMTLGRASNCLVAELSRGKWLPARKVVFLNEPLPSQTRTGRTEGT